VKSESAYLRDTWYVAGWADELRPGSMLLRRLLDEFYVLLRNPTGDPVALVDRCPHRFAPLSMGKLVADGTAIQCPYHGLQFDLEGRCIHNPHSDGRVPRCKVPALPVVEKFSAIWTWMGNPEAADPGLIPDFDFLSPTDNAVACDRITIASHYELETDNILDLSHIEYIHPLFSSDAVLKGDYECVVEGDTVWSKRSIRGDRLPPFLHDAFGLAPEQTADRWLNTRWDAPACMALWTGGVASGRPPAEGRETVGAHLFTPETRESTHYFFATSYPRSLGPDAQRLADESIAVATGPQGVFTTEDKPIIEAQARNMLGRDFWDLRPRLLSIDAASVRARQILAKKIRLESDGNADATP
jgi:phenylpropionate dioxygenase-like ring-hydroxylating dioxygenase large terminal subunit